MVGCLLLIPGLFKASLDMTYRSNGGETSKEVRNTGTSEVRMGIEPKHVAQG